MRATVWIAGLLATSLVGCGEPAVTGEPEVPGPTGQEVCREPLGPDDPHPIGTADGPHEALAGNWFEPLGEQVHGAHADETGGMWLDQQEGEVVVMVMADDPRRVLDELRGVVDDEHADRVVCMTAEYTETELEELQREVFDRLTAAGSPDGGGIDTVRNAVTVEWEGDLDEAEAALGDLADHPALVLNRPDCADIAPLPDEAIALPGEGSTCGGMDALLTGTLGGDVEAGCLWIEGEAHRSAIAWPRGWWVSPDGVVHDHRGEARAVVGDEVAAGGGSVPDAWEQLPEACRTGESAFLLNSLDSA